MRNPAGKNHYMANGKKMGVDSPLQFIPTVEVNHLFKSYSAKTAVEDLSFSANPGEILGLIGPNGAGKSTTIKTILNFIKPDSGEVALFGGSLNGDNKNQIGYLPEERGLYKKLPAIDLIIYLASLKNMERKAALEKADRLLELTGMLANKTLKIEEMSKGMAQMIQLIVTIVHDPKLIILDEPFSGLDPVNRDLLRGILRKLRDEGKTVILSTHQMNEVEELCDRILMIEKGRAVLYGELGEIKLSFRDHSILVSYEGELGELQGIAERRYYNDLVELFLADHTKPQQVLAQLLDQEIIIKRFEVTTPSLHEIFIKMAGDHD